jgi:hypothetical protein
VLNTVANRCLFNLGTSVMSAFCPPGTDVHSATQCVSYGPCPDGTYGAQCRYKPDSSAICNYADQITPL